MADINAPLSVYGIPSSQSNQPEKPGPLQFSAEDVRARMAAINDYIDTNAPKIYTGLALAEMDRANKVAPLKNMTAVPRYTIPDIQNLISGDTHTGPLPGLRDPSVSRTDFASALIEKARTESYEAKDPFIYSRPTSFNGTKDGVNFDRYYSHPQFKKLGISIYRDNESLYNANSSWSDDFMRMGKKWFSLFGGGFAGMARSWVDSSYSDIRAAAQMQHDMSVASSSKEGFGAAAINFMSNSAYTFGVLAEMGTENFIAAAAARFTGGQSLRASITNTAKNLARYTKVMSSTVEMMKNVQNARKVFNAAKLGQKAVNLLPFAETATFGLDLLKTESAVNRLSKIAKAKRGLGSFYRDMRMINAAASESRLEAGFVENKVAQESMDEFKRKNKRMPTVEEAFAISEKAHKAGATTFMANAPIIYYTNKFVLDNMFRGFAPTRRLMSRTALNSPLYKLVTNPGWRKAGVNPYSYVKKGLLPGIKGTVFSKAYLKSIPTRLGAALSIKNLGKTAGSGLRYFQANLMEGLQESYQEVVQAAATDYYLNQYYSELYGSPFLAGNKAIFHSIAKGVEDQYSSQGLEVFASGFLMGGVMGGFQNAVLEPARRATGALGDKIFKTDDYKKYQQEEEKRFQTFVNAANDIAMNPQKYINLLDENAKNQSDLQRLLDDYEEVGDRKSAQDAIQDSLFNHIRTMRSTGNFDAFIEHLEDYRNLTDDELTEAFKNTPGNDRNTKDYRSRLESAIKKAKQINEVFDKLDNVDNPFNPDIFDKERDPEGYVDELISYNAFEEAKMTLAFNQYSFERAAKRMIDISTKAAGNGPFGNVGAIDFYSLYDTNPDRLIEFGKTLKLEIEALMMGDADDKKKGALKLEQFEKLRFVRNRIMEFKKGLDLIEKASTGNKEALDKLRAMANEFAKESNIIGDYDNYTVNLETGQTEMLFEPLPSEVLPEDIAPDIFVEEYLKNMLYDAYYDYVKAVGSVHNIYNTKDSADDSFGDLIDFLKLDKDVRVFAGHINTLSDPMALYNLSIRYKNARKKVLDQYQKIHKEALAKFNSMIDLDAFFQRLADMDVYFNPEQIDEFLNNNIMPDAFLEAGNGAPILPSNPKYNAIIDLIEAYEKETGKVFTNKPTRPKPKEEPKPTVVSAEVPPEEKEKETPPAATTTTTTADPLAAYPKDIQAKLREAYTKSGTKASIEEWMKESPIAASILNPTPRKKRKVVGEDYISKSNPRSLSESLVNLLYKMLLPIYTPKYKLVDEDRYVSGDNPADTAKRVSDIKGVKPEDSLLLRRQAGRGTILDNKLRAFAEPFEEDGLSIKDRLINAHIRFEKTGNSDELEEVRYALEQYTATLVQDGAKLDNPLEITENFAKDFAKVLEALALEFRDYTWHTSLPPIVGNILGDKYGGSIDLLLEKKNSDGKSEFTIVDFKSSSVVRRLKPGTYKYSDQIQQNAYADLFEQKTNRPVKDIRIFNMIVTSSSDGKTLTGVALDKYKNVEGQSEITYPVARMPILDAKLQEMEATKNNEIAEIKKSGLSPESEAATIKEIEDRYNTEVEELKAKAATTGQTPITPAPVSDIEAKKADIEKKIAAINFAINTFLIDKNNYISWSNIRDKSDQKQFLDAVSFLQSQLEKGASKKILTKEDIDDIWSSHKVGRNKKTKEGVTPLLIELSQKYAELAALGKTTPVSEGAKNAVPSRFAGKVIYTPYGFVDSSIFEKYDIINADDVLKEVGRKLGFGSIANYDRDFAKIIFDLEDTQREKVYNAFKEEIEKLKMEGKTIISSNWVLRDSADIISYPPTNKAVDQAGFVEALSKSTALKKLQEQAQAKGWEITRGKVESKTRKTLGELFESEKAVSDGVTGIKTIDTIQGLSNVMSLYFTNKDNFRDRFNTKDKDGNVTPLTAKEVVDIALERAQQLAGKMANGGPEYNKFAKKVNKMLNKEAKAATKAVEKEQKADIQSVVDSGKDVSAVSTEVADIVKNAKASTLSREDRRNNLKDKLGC